VLVRGLPVERLGVEGDAQLRGGIRLVAAAR
jgi:hypothetical protein